LLLATCIFIGAFVSQSAYGDAARLIVGQWTSSLPLKRPGLPVQPSPSAAQVVAAEPMPPQSTPSAQTVPQEAAPTVAPLSPELAQMLQTMAHDLANVQQGIEQLKTSQEQTASCNAKALELLKTISDNAKALEHLP
jgi:small-conductance mechanosensitive channel